MFLSLVAAFLYSVANIVTSAVFVPAHLGVLAGEHSVLDVGTTASLWLLCARSVAAFALLLGAARVSSFFTRGMARTCGWSSELRSPAYLREIGFLFVSQVCMVFALGGPSPALAVAGFFAFPWFVQVIQSMKVRRMPSATQILLGLLVLTALMLCAATRLAEAEHSRDGLFVSLSFGFASGLSFALHLSEQATNVRRTSVSPLLRTTVGFGCLTVLSGVAVIGERFLSSVPFDTSNVTSWPTHAALVAAAALLTVLAVLATFFALRRTSPVVYAALSATSPTLTLLLEGVFSHRTSALPTSTLLTTSGFSATLVVFALSQVGGPHPTKNGKQDD